MNLAIFGQRVMVIAPHADDAELGCGGLIKALTLAGVEVQVIVLTVGASAEKVKTRVLELEHSMGVLGVTNLSIFCYGKDGDLHSIAHSKVVTFLDDQQNLFKPTTVLLPLPSSHQDHKYAWDVCVAATRPRADRWSPNLVAAYEYPLTCWGEGATASSFHGGMYVDITAYLPAKMEALACYESQMREGKSLISVGAAETLATLRGYESGYGASELFHVLRMRITS